MSKYTPGPWAVDEPSDKNLDFIVRYPETSYVVARVRAPANAHLIASAPELLRLLKHALELYQTSMKAGPGTAEAYRAAIAKAEGK